MEKSYSTHLKERINILIFFFIAFCFIAQEVKAQVSGYSFSTATGTALNSMAAGTTTLIAAAIDDGASAVTNIGFSFVYGCTTYTQFSVNSNGLMRLGGTAVSTAYSNILASATDNPKITAYWDDISTGTAASGSKVHYKLSGTSPNRFLVVEWLARVPYGTTSAYNATFQVVLTETTNTVKFIYGTGAAGSSYSVGLATSATDYLRVDAATNTAANTGSSDAQTTTIASGRSYTFTPGSTMTYTSSTVTQASVATVTKCAVNQPIVCVEVVASGSCSALSLTQLQMVMTGTAPTADVSLIHIYYTGTSSTFSAVGAFNGAGTAVAAGTITINGSQTLSNGTNYFWIAYDMNASGTTGNTVDARLLASPTTTLTVGGIARTVTANNPAGIRSIIVCPPSPGGISNNITLWLKANAGTTTSAGNVTGWTDQSPAGTTVTVNGSPDYVSVGNNFNPYINFTLSNAGGTGGDYLKTADMALRSFFFVGKLNDLTRKSSHMVTYDGVTFSLPCALCAMHGGENGGAVAQYSELNYGSSNFQAAGVWRKNGDASGIGYNTAHSGNFDIVTSLGAGTASVNAYLGGQVDNLPGFVARVRDWYGPVGELITYSGAITTAEANKIESYLAIKYGITLGGNGSTTLAYTSTNGTTIWAANTGYHYDVTGIGAESTEGLQQNKSKSINVSSASGASDMPFTIAHDLISGATNIGENTYIIVGRNTGTLSGAAVAYTHGGAIMEVEQSRMFRIQTSNLTGGHSMMAMTNLEVEFDMSMVPGLAGGFGLGVGVNDPANIRLLLDDNTTFGQGTAYEKAYANSGVTGNLITFKIPVADLATNGTMFFRIGSTDYAATPLPVELLDFDATCADDKVNLHWTTVSETNNDFFSVARTADGVNFEFIGTVDGAGTSTSQNSYSWTDNLPYEGNSYYRLSQTDFDGTTKTSGMIHSFCEQEATDLAFINTFSLENQLNYNFSTSTNALHSIKLYDAIGNLVIFEEKYFSKGNNSGVFDLSRLSEGIYLITLQNKFSSVCRKIMVLK